VINNAESNCVVNVWTKIKNQEAPCSARGGEGRKRAYRMASSREVAGGKKKKGRRISNARQLNH
jgi:hypothetical protein